MPTPRPESARRGARAHRRRQLDGRKAQTPTRHKNLPPNSRNLKNPRPSAPGTRHQAAPTAKSFAGKSPPNLGEWRPRSAPELVGQLDSGRPRTSVAGSGQGKAGDPAAAAARRPEPQVRKARRGGASPGRLAAPYFSVGSFFDTVPRVTTNQIPVLCS